MYTNWVVFIAHPTEAPLSQRSPSRLLAGALVLALVASFLQPAPAQAEELPPPMETQTSAALPGEPSSTPEAEAVSPEPTAAAPELEATLEPGAAEAAPDGGPAALLAQAPDGTTLAVVDAEGDLLPLASEAAAEIMATGDPIWCPASVAAPTPGANGCTISYTSFASLLGALPALIPADGIIWFEDSYDSGVNDPAVTLFTLDGSGSLSALAPFKLTLRGGWDGLSGSKVITGSSEFNGRLQILNWQNDVTLSDLVFTGTTGGAAAHALQVTTTGNINLTRVNSSNNQGTGALLNNTSGTDGVTVSDSQFNNNAGNGGGLDVTSAGKITLANLTTNGNTAGYGTYLDNTYGSGAVALTGLNTFHDNRYSGLAVWSNGAINASNLDARNNGLISNSGSGAWLQNNSSPTAAGVTLTGTNVFLANDDSGLYISSAGPVKLNNVIANANQDASGVEIYNAAAATAQPVTFTGSNQLQYNGGYGAYLSASGAVSLNNVNASGNNYSGVWLFNNSTGFTSDVTFTGTNVFNDNNTHGLYVATYGNLKAANLSASDNGLLGTYGFGAFLDNSGASTPKILTLSGTNLFSGNYSGGLLAASSGAISASSLSASGNGVVSGTGATLDNSGASSAQKVSLTGANLFRDNRSTGLVVYSNGAISASNLTASGNGTGGSGEGVLLANSGAPTAVGVTVSGTNRFLDNRNSGLYVASTGAVSLSNLTASGNGVLSGSGWGLRLDNTSGTGAIKLTGTHAFLGNYSSGVEISSNGAITVSTLTSSGSANSSGVWLSNTGVGPANQQNITFTGPVTTNNNRYDGLQVYTFGSITTKGLTAIGNGVFTGSGSGVYLTNSGGAAARPITLNNLNTLSDNADYGLDVSSDGAIKVNGLTAERNGISGASLGNSTSAAAITLTGSSRFFNNREHGLYVYALGPITLAGVTASYNGVSGSGYGMYLVNNSAAAPQPVKITANGLYEYNTSGGLNIFSLGAISVAGLTVRGSSGNGVQLYNNGVGAAGAVTLTGSSLFEGSFGSGLVIYSRGAIALKTTRLQFDGNGYSGSGYGAFLNNTDADTPMAVTLSGASSFSQNRSGGLWVASEGAISVANVTAHDTLIGIGVQLNNAFPGATAGITLSGSHSFVDNGGSGLEVNTQGPITVGNLTANANGQGGFGYGVFLANFTAANPQPVKLTGTNQFNGNQYTGLSVQSIGAVSANNLSASGSLTDSGAILDNSFLGGAGGITLTGTNTFVDNDEHGLYAISLGAIAANNLTANDNGLGAPYGYGAYLANTGAATLQTIKLTGSSTFDDNYSGGLYAWASGALSANSLTARNTANGAGVDMGSTGLGSPVTLTGVNLFSGNLHYGLYVASQGAVTLSKITGNANGIYGLYVNTPGDVTLTCGSFTSNTSYGVYVQNAATLKLIGVFAAGNAFPEIQTSGVGPITIVRSCP